MSENAIEIKSLVKQFGKFRALDNLTISIEAGKIHGFVGPNGAGKTTTMKVISGALIPTSGFVSVKGFKAGTIDAKKLLGYAPEFPGFYSDMSGLDYLTFMGLACGLTYKEAIRKSMKLLDFMSLTAHKDKKVVKFSTGMKKKVGLAQAMIHDPEILLLDEPTANLDPTSRLEIMQDLKNLVSETKLTILISSHVLAELETLVTDVTLINKGALVLQGSMEVIRDEFRNGRFTLSTSNDSFMANALLEAGTINSVVTDEKGKLRIIAKDTDIFKKSVIKIAYENSISVNSISEEDVSLDSIYKSVILGKGDTQNVSNI